jgi:hypothetical protein
MSIGNHLLNYAEGGDYLFCLILVSLQYEIFKYSLPSFSSFWNWINDISRRVKNYFFIFLYLFPN